MATLHSSHRRVPFDPSGIEMSGIKGVAKESEVKKVILVD